MTKGEFYEKVVKVFSLVLLMVAICSTTVAALPSSVTKTYPQGTVKVTISRSPEVQTSITCTNTSNSLMQLHSFTTKYYYKEEPSITKTDYQTGSGIGLISKKFTVPKDHYAHQTNATVSVDALGFYESVQS